MYCDFLRKGYPLMVINYTLWGTEFGNTILTKTFVVVRWLYDLEVRNASIIYSYND